MAIKVGGTSVISDSRVLENVTGLKTVNSNSLLGSGNIAVGGGTMAVGTNSQAPGGNHTIALGSDYASKPYVLSITQNSAVTISSGTTDGSGNVVYGTGGSGTVVGIAWAVK
jgi:hypothetical protein